jgi:hypothetical protein
MSCMEPSRPSLSAGDHRPFTLFRFACFVVAIASAGFIGCADTITNPGTGLPPDRLVAGLAKAMETPELRMGIRDAMRASPNTEHKLVLGELLRTPLGARVIQSVASALGSDEQAIRTALSRLAPMQFYVPAKSQRLAWSGGQDIAVAMNLSASRRYLSAIAPNGRRIPYDMSTPITESDTTPTLFLLEPLEGYARRIDPQSKPIGSVIQDADDGELGGFIHFTDKFGLRHTAQLADVMGRQHAMVVRTDPGDPCDPTAILCDGTGSGGGPNVNPSYLRRLEVRRVCDNGDCNQGNEFEFITQTVQSNNTVRFEQLIQLNGVASVDVRENVLIIADHP